ncbi:MAG: hypothetical protein IKI08_06605 [Selenomonadaceae bacterium]|nr:hypothetical protein [Selenomonadaceae bacterium]
MEDLISKWSLTAVCIIAMGLWALRANTKFKRSVDENPFGDYGQPNTASVLGVLGTFIGIAWGLFNFDPSPEAMHDSVTNLLGGMTTAFVTSILGMGISLYFKNYQANAQKNFSKNNFNPEANIADLIQYLQQADAEKSAQIKHLEKILQDNNENIIRELRDFGKTLAESNSKAFIEALNETMKDFNQKLTEQFGENFKQLNIAVGRLLVWQENYKVTIERMTEDFQITLQGIDAVKNSVVKIEKSAASITESSEQILNLIVTANMYEQKLRQVLSEIQSVSKNTTESVENLTASMQNVTYNANYMTRGISATANTALSKITDTTNQTIASMRKMSEELRNESFKITSETVLKMEKMMAANDKNFRESLETLGKAMLQISKKFAEDYSPLAERLKEIVKIAEQVRPSGRGGRLL